MPKKELHLMQQYFMSCISIQQPMPKREQHRMPQHTKSCISRTTSHAMSSQEHHLMRQRSKSPISRATSHATSPQDPTRQPHERLHMQSSDRHSSTSLLWLCIGPRSFLSRVSGRASCYSTDLHTITTPLFRY